MTDNLTRRQATVILDAVDALAQAVEEFNARYQFATASQMQSVLRELTEAFKVKYHD